MKPEAQRIAIAEACGYSRQEPDSVWFDSPSDGQIYVEGLPDYINDLNAMHEAEKVMLGNLGTWTRYVAELKIQSEKHQLPHFHLTAAQRAEALLRTLNLWQQ